MEEEMTGRAKCRTIQSDKRGRKEYIKESDIEIVKDVLRSG